MNLKNEKLLAFKTEESIVARLAKFTK